MQRPLQQFEATLKQHGHSVTASRRTLFLALLDKEPQLIGTIVRTVSASMNRSSVYRCLELFEQLGIVRRLQKGFKQLFELTDLFQAHHHHIHCIRCGALEAIDVSTEVEHSIEQLAALHNYQPTNHVLEVEGICPNCQQR